MSSVRHLLNHLLHRAENKNVDSPVGYCPNCWGTQQYGSKFYDAVKKNDLDFKDSEAKKGWVSQYADRYLSDVELRPNGEHLVCSNCNRTYDML